MFEKARHDDRCFGPFDVKRERFLPAVQPDEMARHPKNGGVVCASEVATCSAFDFDHTRAKIDELTRGKGNRDRLLQRDDKRSREWRRRHAATIAQAWYSPSQKRHGGTVLRPIQSGRREPVYHQ